LVKPVQQNAKTVKADKKNLEIVNNIEPNEEFDDGSDDAHATSVTGITTLYILK